VGNQQYLNLAMHNVRGINLNLKQQLWMDFCHEENYHIISWTETKLTATQYEKILKRRPFYIIYTSNCTTQIAKMNESSMGTALAVARNLQHYINNIQKVEGTAISLDLHFPYKRQVRVVSVYLPCSNEGLRRNTETRVMEWVQAAKKKGYETIIMGDFNFDRRKSHKRLPKIFTGMKSIGLESAIDYFGIDEDTWCGSNSSSQIDDIWSLVNMLARCERLRVEDSSEITDSDHKILSMKWHINIHLDTKKRKRKGRWKYKYEQMGEKEWEDFAKLLDDRVEKGNYQSILTSRDLDKTWNKLVNDISCISKQLIPRVKIRPQTSHEFTALATKLHSALNKINRLIRVLKAGSAKTREEINKEISKINKLSGLNIPNYVYEELSDRDVEEWIHRLKEI